jgi:hypothetical protein
MVLIECQEMKCSPKGVVKCCMEAKQLMKLKSGQRTINVYLRYLSQYHYGLLLLHSA